MTSHQAPYDPLKRVRFAADRVEDDAETPDALSISPLKLRQPPAVAVEVPDQVMSEGASGAPDAAPSDSSHSESETKRLHTDHSTRDVVMLLDDSDVSRAVGQCREVCRRRETFLVDVKDWNCEFRDKLRACCSDGTTVACSSGGTSREFMSNVSCLLDLLAAARNGNGDLPRKTIRKCVRRHKRKAKMGATLKKRWETRDQMIGSKPDDQKELEIRNRTLRWCKDGLVFAANLRHGREVVDELGLSKSKPVSSPGSFDGWETGA